MSYFSKLDLLPEDPILGIPPLFARDPRDNKINLGVGAYRDASGRPLVLRAVQKAERFLLDKKLNKEYLPIEGDKDYREQTLDLILGAGSPHKEKAFAAQTVGATSALKVFAEVLKKNAPSCRLYVSSPTWANHHLIFARCGFEVEEYPYCKEGFLDFENFKASLLKAEPKSAIVLHASCHNPTGLDPTKRQWQEISDIMLEKSLFPFFDMAYQGFGDGLEKDAFPIRYFADQGHEMAIASSHSKNFGLYGERVGHLAAIVKNPEALKTVASHIKKTIRSLYSSPPAHGAGIVSTILGSIELKKEWIEELEAMRGRIQSMRRALANELKNLPYIREQKGMFSLLNLTPEQITFLIEKKALYMLPNGRINIAGLNQENLSRAAQAIKSVL